MRVINSSYLILVLLTVLSFNVASAQDPTDGNSFGVGFSAGVHQTSLTSPTGFFRDQVAPYTFDASNNMNFQIHAVYNFGLYESLRLDVSTREFSVGTDYSEWPSLTFDNRMISTVLSAELSVLRYLNIHPRPLNIYGKFGFGFNSNSVSVTFRDNEIPTGSETSGSLSAMYQIGAGLRYHIVPALSLFTEYDLFVSNNEIIEPGFINEYIDTDFTQTASRWGMISAGLRINFSGKSRQSAPAAAPSFSATSPVTENHPSLSDLTIVAEAMTLPLPVPKPTDAYQQLTSENNRRFRSYAFREFPFSDRENLIVSAQTKNRSQISQPVEPSRGYGSTGIWNPELSSGYTIIVHSLASENDANRIAGELQESGLRTTVLNVVVNGINYYRVAIGQFTTRNDASSAASKLASPLNSSFFVVSIPN